MKPSLLPQSLTTSIITICLLLSLLNQTDALDWPLIPNTSNGWTSIVTPYSGPGAVMCPTVTSYIMNNSTTEPTDLPTNTYFSNSTMLQITSTTFASSTTSSMNANASLSVPLTPMSADAPRTTLTMTENVTASNIGSAANWSVVYISTFTVYNSSAAAQTVASPPSYQTFNSLSTTASVLSTISEASPSSTTASIRYRGFNVVNSSPNRVNQWKNSTEWAEAFQNIRSLSGEYNGVRLYSTTDGNTKHLENALPAARKLNLSIHAGVWSGGDLNTARFADEKLALDEALQEFGCDSIIAVSVGNEDMYANNPRDPKDRVPLTDIMLLVNQTQEIMDVLDKHNCCDTKITHTDTAGAWLQTNVSEPLIKQVDFLTVNIFPYWESLSIDIAGTAFWEQLNQTMQIAATYGKDVWVGETGWPIRGAILNEAVPSVSNLGKYWNDVGCLLMNHMNSFWYVEWDDLGYSTATSFGLMNQMGDSVIGDVSCAADSS